MKRYWAVFVAVLLVSGMASGEQLKFKDLPDDHWAASSVYDLVKLGVTKGYPDGTFRGAGKITRFETAVFLSKFAKAIGAEDLKGDLKKIKDDISRLKKGGEGVGLSGSYQADWLLANLLSGGARGAIGRYRLILTSAHEFGDGVNVIVNLDTMDYGWGSTAGGVLGTELFGIESNLRLDLGWETPVNLKLTYGSGVVQHTDATGVVPSETGQVYKRPDTAILASTRLWGADVSAGYIALTQTAAGRLTTSKITGKVGVPLFTSMKLEVSGDYLSSGFISSTPRDVRANIALSAPLSDKIKASGKVGLAGASSSNIMVAGGVALEDVWETGTVINLNLVKVGSLYITQAFAADEFDFAGLDSFDRPLINSTVNIGGKIVQLLSEDIKLVGKGDYRLNADYGFAAPGGRLTAQGGVSYTIAPNTVFDAMYRLHNDRATGNVSDIAALGLLYNF